MNIYILGDTHWNHENIKKYENRPDDHNEQIIANWKKVVQPEDLIIHLGDVIMGPNSGENLREIMNNLPGKKVLCRGNHDTEKKWGTGVGFMERGFDFVCDYFVYDRYVFSHCPTTPLPHMANLIPDKETPPLVDCNFHSHFHRKNPTDDGGNFQPGFYDPKYFWENRNKYQNISDHFEDELRPFSLEEVIDWWLSKGGEE